MFPEFIVRMDDFADWRDAYEDIDVSDMTGKDQHVVCCLAKEGNILFRRVDEEEWKETHPELYKKVLAKRKQWKEKEKKERARAKKKKAERKEKELEKARKLLREAGEL